MIIDILLIITDTSHPDCLLEYDIIIEFINLKKVIYLQGLCSVLSCKYNASTRDNMNKRRFFRLDYLI